MSNYNFTNVHNALSTLLEEIKLAHRELLFQANAERQELLGLCERMRGTRNSLNELGVMSTEASLVLGEIGSTSETYASFVNDAIEDGYDAIPECNYEDFVGFCSECGETITKTADYTETENAELLCANCADFEADTETTETTAE